MSSQAPFVRYRNEEQFPFRTWPAIEIGTSQTVAIGATSVQSSAVDSNTSLIRLFSTVDCFITVGSNPTATTSHMILPAGIVEYIGITGGHKLAVIRNSASGTLYMTEALGGI